MLKKFLSYNLAAGLLLGVWAFGSQAGNVQAPLLTPATQEQQVIQSLLSQEAPLDLKDQVSLARNYEKTGQWEAAATAWDSAIAKDPANREFLRSRQNLYAWMGRYSEGIARFEADLKAHPDRLYLHLPIGHLLTGLQRYGQAMTHVTIAAQNKDTAYDALMLAGTIYREVEDWHHAVQTYQEVIEMDPADLYPLEFLCEASLKGDMKADTIAYLESQIAQRPDAPEFYRHLARFYSKVGRQEEAEATIKRYEALTTDEKDAFHRLAGILENGGKLEEALAAVFNAKKVGEDEFTLDRVKDILFRLQRIEDGIAYFKVLNDRNPKPYVSRILYQFYEREQALADMGLWAADFVRQDPYNAAAYAALGSTLARQDLHAKALLAYQKAAVHDLKILDHFRSTKETYLKLDQFDQGIGYFQGAIQTFPEKSYLYFSLGQLYQAKGDVISAKGAFNRYLELAPIHHQMHEVDTVHLLKAQQEQVAATQLSFGK